MVRHDPITIETVERDAWQDLFAAAPRATAEAFGLRHCRVGGMGLLACPGIPITELNRAMAVDVEGDASETGLAEAAAWLAEHGSAGAFQISPAAREAPTLAWLREHGFAPGGNGWAKFHLGDRSASPASGRTFQVREVDAGAAEVFGAVVQSGFGLPEATAPWFAALVGRPGWRTYLAFDGDEPAAAATMYVRKEAAWFGIDATLACFRRRGAHAALIGRRIADARASGTAHVSAETGYPSPDADSFPSYRSYRSAGFDLAYVRPNYKLA